MCGIVGYIGQEACAPLLLDALKRLEYRGYDSAGLAVHDGTQVHARRAVGKLRNLDAILQQEPLKGSVGIGHTRWATHGGPSEINAHPHTAGPVAVVHNGIIENHLQLRAELEGRGCQIVSDTDTEIVAHLIAENVNAGQSLQQAVAKALGRVHGAFAIAVVSQADPSCLVIAKNASPLVIGLGEQEMFCASDIPAILPYTQRMIFLDDGEIATLQQNEVRVETLEGQLVDKSIEQIHWSPVMAEKAGYKHFMLKEIMEQPRSIEDTLRGRIDRENGHIHSHEIGLDTATVKWIKRVVLLACGTSYHASLAGRHFIENLTGLPTHVELASEFRERNMIVCEGDLIIAVSQSGETIDTLSAARSAQSQGAKVLALVNVVGSAIARLADATFYTHAGPEIGVASTKCFTTQLVNLLMLAIYLGREREVLKQDDAGRLIEGLARIPQHMGDVLVSTRQLVANIARRHLDARDVLYLGRGLNYPIALEGALKLKEISYLHAEGYAAGEMKHGPIALIDDTVPVIVIVPKDNSHARTMSNLQEAQARGARIIAIANENDALLDASKVEVIEIPEVDPLLHPFLTVLPLQLYAYYTADFKGTDVDQPRNLAKTVTVE